VKEPDEVLIFNKLSEANPKSKSVINPANFYCSQVVNLDSDFRYRLLSLIHTQASYKLNLVQKKRFHWRVRLAIMQKAKLKKRNFSSVLDTQSALTERHVANETKKQNVLKQLDIFIQNSLGRHVSYEAIGESTTENRGHMTLACLAKSGSSFKLAPYAPIQGYGGSRMNLRVKINNELRRIRRKIDCEKSQAKKTRLISAYEDLVYTLKASTNRELM